MKRRNILDVIDSEAKDVSDQVMKETLVIIINPFDFPMPVISYYTNLMDLKQKRDSNPGFVMRLANSRSDKVELHRISRNVIVLVQADDCR